MQGGGAHSYGRAKPRVRRPPGSADRGTVTGEAGKVPTRSLDAASMKSGPRAECWPSAGGLEHGWQLPWEQRAHLFAPHMGGAGAGTHTHTHESPPIAAGEDGGQCPVVQEAHAESAGVLPAAMKSPKGGLPVTSSEGGKGNTPRDHDVQVTFSFQKQFM